MGVDIKRLVFQLSNAPDHIPAEEVIIFLLSVIATSFQSVSWSTTSYLLVET